MELEWNLQHLQGRGPPVHAGAQESESFSFLSVHVVLYLAFAGFSTGHALGYVWQYDNKSTDISVFFCHLFAKRNESLWNILQFVKHTSIVC